MQSRPRIQENAQLRELQAQPCGRENKKYETNPIPNTDTSPGSNQTKNAPIPMETHHDEQFTTTSRKMASFFQMPRRADFRLKPTDWNLLVLPASELRRSLPNFLYSWNSRLSWNSTHGSFAPIQQSGPQRTSLPARI